MRKFFWLAFFMAITFAACDESEIKPIQQQTDEEEESADDDREAVADEPFTITLIDSSSADVCASSRWQLNAGNTFKNAGTVSVSNDNTTLFITVSSTYGFQNQQENIKLWVGTDLASVPSKNGGQPLQGQFNWKATVASGTHEYTFTIPFTEIGTSVDCNSKLYVFVHADVISDAQGTTDTAWSGDNCTTSGSGAGNWFCYGVHQAKCCTAPPVEEDGSSETAFAKGGYVFTTDKKSNPENLSSLNLTKNRWGWAINIKATGETTYDLWAAAGLNDTSNGTKVGSLTVTRSAGAVTVTYTMSAGFKLAEIHVYAGDTKPTTIAPGQYGNLERFSPYVTTYSETYTVADTDGDGIWLIAHASVFGNF
jgi:hypothetical protein